MRFDWSTLLLQTINVLVLIWLLRRFLFRPVLEIIAARKDAAEKLLADAAAVRTQANAGAAAVADQEQKLAAESNRVLAEARVAAAAERSDLLERASREATQARDAAQAGLRREREQMRHELQAEAQRLAVTIAERLLTRVPARSLNAALLQSLDTWLTTLPLAELESLARPGETLEIVTAAPLDAENQAACTKMLGRHFGTAPPLHFTTDPSLLAGVELRSPHARLRNNWRADLDRIAQELSRDDERLAVA
jgi:F-type H+-transporting ATPase subunit b